MSAFDGSDNAVTVEAYVQVDAGAELGLLGTIENSGTIDVGNAGGGAALDSAPMSHSAAAARSRWKTVRYIRDAATGRILPWTMSTTPSGAGTIDNFGDGSGADQRRNH